MNLFIDEINSHSMIGGNKTVRSRAESSYRELIQLMPTNANVFSCVAERV